MGRELQKRKRRSSRPKVTTHNRGRKVLNPSGHGVISQNWDKQETLTQNYSRFGLVAKLGRTAGGVTPSAKTVAAAATGSLAHTPRYRGMFQVAEVKVERDESGRIVRVVREENPLGDLLNELSDSESEGMADDGEEWGGIDIVDDQDRPLVVRKLEQEAAQPTVKTVRHQSDRELEWLQDLVAKHGNSVEAMARDRKLNPMQQTAANIRKRLRKAGLVE